MRSFRQTFRTAVLLLLVSLAWRRYFDGELYAAEPDQSTTGYTLGYSEHRTNLPGGRHANVSTGRACVIGLDGTGRRDAAGRTPLDIARVAPLKTLLKKARGIMHS